MDEWPHFLQAVIHIVLCGLGVPLVILGIAWGPKELWKVIKYGLTGDTDA